MSAENAENAENAELVRAVFAGWDEAGVEGMLPFFHSDIEYLPMEEAGAIHGHAGLRRYFERWMDPWEEFSVRPTEILTEGDRVLNGVAMKAVGRGSGVEVDMEYWQVWLIREGRAVRFAEYLARDDALAALRRPSAGR